VFGGVFMSDEKEIVYKPNRTTMITSGEISVLQRKVYNVMLHQAQRELKKDNSQILFLMSLAKIKDQAGIHASNNVHVKKSIDKLRFTGVETVYENGDWLVFNLIAQARKQGDLLEIQFPEFIRQSLITNTYYTTLDLMIIKQLQGKYAVILYEMAMRYHKKEIPELTIEEFRKLTGTLSIKSYNNFGANREKVIVPAIKEINKKTDIELSYDPIQKIGSRSVTAIKFFVKKKKQENQIEVGQLDFDKYIHWENGEVEENQDYLVLYSLLPESEQREKRKEDLKKLLKEHSFEYLESDIKYCKRMEIKKGFWGYLLSSVKNGHYSADEIRKKEMKLEKKKNIDLLEEKEMKLKEEKIKEILDDPSEEILIRFEKDYTSLPEMFRGKDKSSFFKTWLNRYVDEIL